MCLFVLILFMVFIKRKQSLLFSHKILNTLNNQGFCGETCSSFFGNVFGSETE